MKKRIFAILLALVVLTLSAAAEDMILTDDGITVETERVDEAVEEAPETGLTLEGVEGLEVELEVTYVFLNGEAVVDSQTVRDGEAIKAPAAPEAPEGKAFAGWYIGETLLFADEDTAVVSVQPDIQYVYVEAVFADAAEPAEEPEEAASPEADEQPAEEQPADEQPADEQPSEDQPADEQPADEQPSEDQPADEQPAEEQPAEEQPAEEQPGEEAPADEQPADEQSADEQPAEEAPADEQPADEQPSEDQPADEQPAEEQPAEEQPADEQPAPQPVEALIYNGGPQALVTAAEGWLFSLNGEDYSPALPTGTDAGEYVVFYRSPNGEAGQLTAAIAKADVMFTPPVAATGE